MRYLLIFVVLFLTACGKSDPKPYDPLADAYAQCYNEMTQQHISSGLAERNRKVSIEIKETTCKAKIYGQGGQ